MQALYFTDAASSLLLPTAPRQPEASAAVSVPIEYTETVEDAVSVQEAVSASVPSRAREPESLEVRCARSW